VAAKIAVLALVSVAMMPVNAMSGAPHRGKNLSAAMLNAWFDPSNADQGIVPRVTSVTVT
jgi:hypothetical protein